MSEVKQEGSSQLTKLTTQMIVSDPTTRYFLIKSYNNDNIGRSQQYGVWATSQRNERVFAVAYQSAAYVVLVFSVNHSSRFSGFGVMTSSPGESSCEGRPIFCGPDGSPFPGKMFNVHWITSCEVYFRDCENIQNSFNENKPVKVGRDGQEIDPDAGRQLAELIESQQPQHSRPASLMIETVSTSAYTTTQKDRADRNNRRLKPPGSDSSLTASLQQLAKLAKFLKKSSSSISDTIVDVPKHSIPQIDWEADKIMLRSDLKNIHHIPNNARNPTESPNEQVSSNHLVDVDEGVTDTTKTPLSSEHDSALISANFRKSFSSTDTSTRKAILRRTPSWSFEWLIDIIANNPLLAVFPLDLTVIPSFEDYLDIVVRSQSKWDEVSAQYDTDLPPLPESLRIPKGTVFDAEMILNIFARSASQENIDHFLKMLVPLLTQRSKPLLPVRQKFPSTRPDLDNVRNGTDNAPLLTPSVYMLQAQEQLLGPHYLNQLGRQQLWCHAPQRYLSSQHSQPDPSEQFLYSAQVPLIDDPLYYDSPYGYYSHGCSSKEIQFHSSGYCEHDISLSEEGYRKRCTDELYAPSQNFQGSSCSLGEKINLRETGQLRQHRSSSLYANKEEQLGGTYSKNGEYGQTDHQSCRYTHQSQSVARYEEARLRDSREVRKRKSDQHHLDQIDLMDHYQKGKISERGKQQSFEDIGGASDYNSRAEKRGKNDDKQWWQRQRRERSGRDEQFQHQRKRRRREGRVEPERSVPNFDSELEQSALEKPSDAAPRGVHQQSKRPKKNEGSKRSKEIRHVSDCITNDREGHHVRQHSSSIPNSPRISNRAAIGERLEGCQDRNASYEQQPDHRKWTLKSDLSSFEQRKSRLLSTALADLIPK